MWTEILSGVGGGAIASISIAFLLREVISNRLKNAIEHEYKLKFAEHALKLDSLRKNDAHKFELKYNACMSALKIADAVLSNLEYSGQDCDKINQKMVREPVHTESVRDCFNRLACACDKDKVLTTLKRIVKADSLLSPDAIVDLRNAVREELQFSQIAIDSDRFDAFVARAPGDSRDLHGNH